MIIFSIVQNDSTYDHVCIKGVTIMNKLEVLIGNKI